MYTLDFMSFPGWIALVSLFLIVGQLIFSLIFGNMADLDTDGDGFGDFDMSSLISPKGIIHFLFGASWYLVLIEPFRENGWLWSDWLISIVIGFAVSLFIVLLYYWMNKLACEKNKECGKDLIGRSGNVYLNLGDGNYEIDIVISDTLTTLKVKSLNNYSYKTGTPCTIRKYENGIYYIS